jgi:hypothetical protein
MLNTSAMSARLPSTMERAMSDVIVPNFSSGLSYVRCAREPLPPPVEVQKHRVRSPQMALLPTRRVPRNGLFVSTLLHAAVIPALLSVRIIVAPLPTTIVPTAPESQSVALLEPIFLPIHAGGSSPEAISPLAGAAGQMTLGSPKRDYAGAQLMISNPPEAAKGVQTILRPDLLEPPKLPYPLRLPSQLALPSATIHVPFSSTLEHPIVRPPKNLSTLDAQTPSVQNPILTVAAQDLSASTAAPVAPWSSPPIYPPAKALEANDAPEGSTRKAIAVVNAIAVPADFAAVTPDAELTSRFVVGPNASTSTASKSLRSDQTSIANASSELKQKSVFTDPKNGLATGQSIPYTDPPNATKSDVQPASKSGSGLTASNDKLPAASSYGLPGISISGGVSGRSRAPAITPMAQRSYPLTIIASGSSAGPSRDLGVFARTDTVYTVYLPMTDVGNGPDCPIQYALLSPGHNGSPNALLTPPVVLKKVQAVAANTKLRPYSEPMFITGIIDEGGKFQSLRAIHAADPRAQAALAALAQWELSAAQLDGNPVAVKVLIGVTVIAAENVGKQD